MTVTYNPTLPNIKKILQKKQPPLRKIYKETPVVAYRRSPNLRDLLVRAKLRNPANTALNQPHGTFRCNSKHRCLSCPHIEDGRTTYTFSNKGEVREIKQHITCKSTNLTYMIECHKCKKQYIGETKRTLRERFTEHGQATNNPSHANATAAVPTHFNLPDHSIKDMKLPFEWHPRPLKFCYLKIGSRAKGLASCTCLPNQCVIRLCLVVNTIHISNSRRYFCTIKHRRNLCQKCEHNADINATLNLFD